MKYYLTTDTHFNHEIIKDYCSRPDNYEELIQNSFRQLEVGKNILIHLGDVCMGNETESHEKYIIPIKCKKILVKGNHDSKSDNWYLEHGWEWVCKTMELCRGGKRILFSHEPMVWNGYWDINIHGHFHNINHRRYEAELNNDLLKRQRLLALEYNDYKLWDLDKILEGTSQ